MLKLAGVIALAAVAWMSCEWALAWRATRAVVTELPELVSSELELTRRVAVEEIRAGRVDVTVAIDRLSAEAARQITKTRADTLEEVRRLRADMVTQSTLWRSDARPVLANAALLEADAARTVRVLTPQLLGAVAASKVTAGNAAQITRDLKPAAQDAAHAMRNAERATRPLGWPVKIGQEILGFIKKFPWVF